MQRQSLVNAWKIFLEGRILQEKRKNEEALKLFERALKIDSNNEYFLNAKCVALAALGRQKEIPVDALFRKGYSELAKTYIGKKDMPDLWIKGIEQLLRKAEDLERKSILIEMCW